MPTGDGRDDLGLDLVAGLVAPNADVQQRADELVDERHHLVGL